MAIEAGNMLNSRLLQTTARDHAEERGGKQILCRPLLVGWRSFLTSRLEAIASRLEAIAIRLRLEAIAIRLEAVGIRLQILSVGFCSLTDFGFCGLKHYL